MSSTLLLHIYSRQNDRNVEYLVSNHLLWLLLYL